MAAHGLICMSTFREMKSPTLQIGNW